MQVEQLIYFTEVYRTKSINTASLNLNITQQSLSTSIKNLEREFDTLFFTRSNKGVVPTEHGDLFYQTAQTILQELALFNEQIHPAPTIPKCRIGYFNADISSSVQLYTILQKQYPSTFFDIATFSRYTLLHTPSEQWPDIIFTFMDRPFFRNFHVPPDYTLKFLPATINFKIWLNNHSLFKNYDQLSNKHLGSIQFAFLKALYPSLDIIRTIYPTITENNSYFAQTQEILVDLLLHHNFSTTEFMVNNKPICFPFLQNSNQFTLKPLTAPNHNNIYFVLLYRNEFDFFYPTVSTFVLEHYGSPKTQK